MMNWKTNPIKIEAKENLNSEVLIRSQMCRKLQSQKYLKKFSPRINAEQYFMKNRKDSERKLEMCMT